ncbi:hypothetical protein FXE51_09720 [Vibrio mimicus]|uniref:hypothetical protein n=1 Tax=Vibrio mimicus TaxID=674 RepID=UPI0011D39C72|nr:hypothetical protein [Vibrio mimicus]TXZ75561.1 hypothetical protein FXE51_09720 [Vibrio mimicus]
MKPIFLILLTLLVGCSDTVKNHYADYQQAQADHLFEKGWLPPILPISTTQIELENDLDSNRSQGSFVIAEQDLEQFVEHLEATEATNQYRFQSGHSVWVFMLDTQGKVRYQLATRTE